jgi:hypothetical protein
MPAPERVDFSDYIDGIRFVHFRATESHFDLANTTLPAADARTKRLLGQICGVPRMSTFAIAAMIQRAVTEMPADEAYVNVGVWHGFSLFAGMLGNEDKRCIGIDDFSQFGGPRTEFHRVFRMCRGRRHRFVQADYRRYFRERHRGSIGVYFYDGPHFYRDQYRGLIEAERFFAPGCRIFVDDTNWDGPRRATLDFMRRRKGHYRLLADRRTSANGHPTFWNGVMVFERRR